MPRTFVFSTYGARGDVFPYLAIGSELRRRGHRVIVATSQNYRAKIESHQLEWAAARPEAPSAEAATRAMHPVSGSEYLFRHLLLPVLRESIADLSAIVRSYQADVLVTHTLSIAGPIVAELEQKNGSPDLRWASSVVSPLVLFEEDAALTPLPHAADFPPVNRVLLALFKRQMGMYLKETQQIRAGLGISRGDNALWGDAHSPALQLCLWDKKFAPVTGAARKATGFCILEDEDVPASQAVEEFLAAGDPPLVFAAGSYANSASWEKESIGAAKILGRRALLLGTENDSRENDLLKCPFAALGPVLNRASAMVHFGGIGTLALGLRASVPMLVVPRFHDQPDNARRARKLGIARVLAAKQYRAALIAQEIKWLLEDEGLRNRLSNWSNNFQNGASNAAGELERF